uniref:Uncharacterized protein n=1 Tax=Xenopus tropicalis TaxID=8364 RepID=A0A1B8Y5I0_XENTR
MGMSASSRQYYEYRYGKISWWIPPDRDIFEIRDFEDPRAGPYLECIRDQIRGDIRMALYDLWMARDCVKITKWWQFRLKADFRGDYRYIKAHLKDLYKDLEAINKTAGAGVCRLPGAQWNGVYATIFPCFPHPASLDYGKQGEGIDSGSKSDCR